MNLTNVLASQDYTTLARVKAMLNVSISDTTQDTLISSMIEMISSQFTDYLGLHALESSRTEVYELKAGSQMISLDARPILSNATLTVKYGADVSNFESITAIAASSYVTRYPQGQIQLLFQTPNNPGFVQVLYTAGLGTAPSNPTDGDGIVERFPMLAYACDLQAKYALQRQDSLGGSTALISGQGTDYEGQYGFLSQVREILDANRRW